MNRAARSLSAFHRIGERSGLEPEGAPRKALRPALFGHYRDLNVLRHDFPLILVDGEAGEWAISLADASDTLLREIAPAGAAGEELRRQVLSLEQEIRYLLEAGERGTLSLFWETARRKLLEREHEERRGRLEKNLDLARSSWRWEGELVEFSADLPARLVTHAWRESQRLKGQRLQARIERLARKLADILRVDYLHSAQAREPKELAGAVGHADQNVFDFDAMARILESAPPAPALPAERRQRIEDAIAVLQGQRFVPLQGAEREDRAFGLEFDDCETAVAAFRERLPDMAELVRAIAIAELEIENRYEAGRHDSFFARFNPEMLGPDDLALFPAYLVTVAKPSEDPAIQSEINRILQAGLPFKILACTGDVLGDPGIAAGQMSFGVRGQQLARMATGLNGVFAMQAPASSLYRLRESIIRGLASEQPALFNVFTGIGPEAGKNELQQAPYLLAAAAAESRAFPCFVYDPAAGPDLASRFRLDGNPAPASDWPRHTLRYEGPDHDRREVEIACTLVDFIAADPRYAGQFACLGDDDSYEELVSLEDFLRLDEKAAAHAVPYVWLIDEQDMLYRGAVGHRLVDAARRCLDAWHRLREFGGIENSYAREAVAEARADWEREKESLLSKAAEAPAEAGTPPEATPAAESPAPESEAEEAVAEPAPAPEHPSDEPWIETVRCTTCNECTEINDRMFAYDADQRAYIADPDAGTYRELVEAAETCQVAIIHPGKPRNPDEPGLEELMERAAPFM